MTIAAVVVTYNRKELLTECLTAIAEQTRIPDTILIIDNASTDGTEEMFAKDGVFDNALFDYQKMESNLGGAGGFYEGIRRAFNNGADWIWIMDDDTIPSKTALEEICNAMTIVSGKISFFASAVYGPNKEPMNVPIVETTASENGYMDWYMYLKKGIIKIEDATFVSLLFNREAVQAVGFPYKDLFIWGDDKEYTLRMTRYYGPAYMVGMSEVTHKRAITKRISIENATDSKRIDQYYYNYRNILVNVREYRHGWLSVLKRIAEFEGLCLEILMDKNQTQKLRKIKTVQRGIGGFFLGTHDKKKFANRFKIGMDDVNDSK